MPRDSAEEPTGLWAAYAAFAGVATGVAAFAAWQLSQAYSKADANAKKIEELKDKIVDTKHEEEKTQDTVEVLSAHVENNEKVLHEVQKEMRGSPTDADWNALRQEKAQLEAENATLRQRIQLHETRLLAIQSEVKAAQDALADSSAECTRLQQQIRDLEAQLATHTNPQPIALSGPLVALGGVPPPAVIESSGGPVGPAATADSTLPAGSPAAPRVGAQFAVPWAYRRYY